MTVQKLNAETVDLLSAHYARRNEPNVAWGNAVGGLLWTPQARGVWPFSSVDSAGAVYDVSGQGRTLTNNGTAAFSVDGLVSYASLVAASTQYFSRADEAGTSITGNLWCSTWVYFNSLGTTMGIVNKWVGTGNQRSYRVYKGGNDNIVFEISNGGTAVDATVTSTNACSINTWHYVAALFIQSTSVSVWLDSTRTINTTSIPATILDSTAPFELGRLTGANYMDGRMSLAGLGSSGGVITPLSNLYHQTRAAFGV